MLNHKVIFNDMDEWVVFLHGIGGNLNTFKKQIEDYSAHYNLLMIDLNGHGNSKGDSLYLKNEVTFETAARDILKVLDYENIYSAHFVGLSLGTMLVFAVAKVALNRVKTMILAGAIVRFEWLAKTMFFTGNLLKPVASYMVLYKIFALAMMPRHDHKVSRNYFIIGAKSLGSKEFFLWFGLMQQFEIQFSSAFFTNLKIPKLYIMGNEDHMFKGSAGEYAMVDEFAEFSPIPDSGHVCNMDNTIEFNKKSLQFLKEHSSAKIKEYAVK